MVITLTDLPTEIEEVLQRKADEEGKSLDRVTLDAIARGLSIDQLNLDSLRTTLRRLIDEKIEVLFGEQRRIASLDPDEIRNLSKIVGSWADDPEFDAILKEQHCVDSNGSIKVRDLSDIAGQHLIDDEMRAIFEEQRRIDPELWQ